MVIDLIQMTKATRNSTPENLRRWIITQNERFMRKCVGKVSNIFPDIRLLSSYFSSPSKIE